MLAVSACVYRFRSFFGATRPQPFVVVLLALCVASSISRRQRACVKGVGKDYKGEKEFSCFQARKIEAQASSLIQAEILFALESAELEERQESSIDIAWNDVRSAVVTESPEVQNEAAAAFGTISSRPGNLEASEKVQPGESIQFFIRGVGGAQTQVMRGGKRVDPALSLYILGITPNCTVYFFNRLRGGSRENVSGLKPFHPKM